MTVRIADHAAIGPHPLMPPRCRLRGRERATASRSCFPQVALLRAAVGENARAVIVYSIYVYWVDRW